MKLQFSRGNAKLDSLEKVLGTKVWSFSTLSGHTCPYAKDCLSQAVEDSQGKRHIQDGPDTVFRCFSASQEVVYPAVYNARKRNSSLIELAAKSIDEATGELLSQLPKGTIRIHVGGDFKTKNYFRVWLNAAKDKPDQLFYAYTKSLPFWVALKNEIPDNFILTASYGGYRDSLIAEHGLRYVKVVNSVQEAIDLGLEIDHDDSHAALPQLRDKSFALLIHGIQPAGSVAGKAKSKLKGEGSYSKGKKSQKVMV